MKRVIELLSTWFSWFIIIWCAFLLSMFAIGGYFMFRKFLKRLPKEDGMSVLDWEEFYIDKTVSFWPNELKVLLEKLILPVPELFRDIARNKIIGKIGEIALLENKSKITHEILIRGYILATPKRDHKFLLKTLKKEQIDISMYQSLYDKKSRGTLKDSE